MTDYYRLPLGDDAPNVVNVVIEIPAGSRNKYEYDGKLGVFALDRVLASPMFYALDYGFMPQTLAGDGDPCDGLVIMDQPTFPGCVIAARPIGMLKMDDGGEDFKILCVPANDKRYDHVTELGHVSPHLLKELQHFFATYKTLEGKHPKVEDWVDGARARAYITECIKTYRDQVLVK